jgi:hypothetical protein
LKDKRGALQKKLLQDDDDKGEHMLLSPKYWLVLYLQEKQEGGGCNALPLLCIETNNMGGMVCSQHFILHEQNKIQRELLPPYFEVKTNKQ